MTMHPMESVAVRRWFTSAGHEREPAAVQDHHLRILADFCFYTRMSPGDLVAFCFLRKRDTGERFVSAKRRIVMNEWIAAFVEEQGWTGKDAVANANVLRGFLIHNGVLIQGRAWTEA